MCRSGDGDGPNVLEQLEQERETEREGPAGRKSNSIEQREASVAASTSATATTSAFIMSCKQRQQAQQRLLAQKRKSCDFKQV